MRLLSYLLLCIMSYTITYAQEYPNPNGYINDYANVISTDDSSYMANVIRDYEKKTSIEIVIVTITDLQGDVIEQYANGLFNTWGIGKKGVDDGLLIMLSLDEADRGLRIEVGYGL